MVQIPTNRTPIHPGVMLLTDSLNPLGISQRELLVKIAVSYQRFKELVNGKRGISPGTALRLVKFFGMSAEFWMNLQLRRDLYHAKRAEAVARRKIEQIPESAEV